MENTEREKLVQIEISDEDAKKINLMDADEFKKFVEEIDKRIETQLLSIGSNISKRDV